MALYKIASGEWQTQRWQNGGGITHQIVRSDDDKGMLWRLSVAEVVTDGPFSTFEGIDRSIMLLSGDGLTLLDENNELCKLNKPLVPFHFSGEQRLSCRLLNGPVRDFNLMLRRNAYESELSVLEVSQSHALSILGHQSLLFVATGDISVVFNRHLYRLHAGETLVWQNENGVLHLDSANTAKAVFITLKTKASV